MTDDSGSTTDETEDSGEAYDSEEDNLRERQSTEQVQEQIIESHGTRISVVYWYMQNLNNGEVEEYNTSQDWITWKPCDKNEIDSSENEAAEIHMVKNCLKVEVSQDTLDAKVAEIESWKQHYVFYQVTDEGQERQSTTGVVTTKVKENKQRTKARLVVKG